MTAECGEALSFFLPHEKEIRKEPLGGGIVNDTWRITLHSGSKYILQRLNLAVFPDPVAVQENLHKVSEHIHSHLPDLSAQLNRYFKPFRLIPHETGVKSYQDSKGAHWRLLTYIEQACALPAISTTHQAEEIGATLGLFHQLLATLPPESLTDPLPGFHDTPLYLAQYDRVLSAPENFEAEDCRERIEQHRKEAFLLENARQQGRISQQLIHADPKVANFLFSLDDHKVISLIDLDTVRPGLLLHDIGDCLRSCCNPLGEEVKSPEDIYFHADFFAAVVKGYLTTAANLLLPGDRALLVDSAWLISFELGLRFYSDYLVKNCYFKVSYPEQNLFRARIQFALARSIARQYDKLCALIQGI
ncbi:MAG: aminoglycoside phosphotransferase family protein [Candidatus Electrothrix aestuarii]|uniref:Aminoglycoside phosphotransferase family protein n=1 Tax=Candidatus Electrothrix aestuarii TaxID=3062594 RepID=A0AAU8M028_9BACT|nr:aminoglycoside phosphotransferase family protein [Candidatus Electrothrix aestuarii]